MNSTDILRIQVDKLRKVVIDDLTNQLIQGRLDLHELSKDAVLVHQWFLRNRETLKPSVAFAFERLFRFIDSSMNELAEYFRQILLLNEDNRPDKKEIQKKVNLLHDKFLQEANDFLILAEKEQNIMTTNNITVKDIVGPVNILSKFDGALQAVYASPNLNSKEKDDLSRLFEDLKKELSTVPKEQTENVELITEQAEEIAIEMKRTNPRPSALRIKGSGLIEAAKSLEYVVPVAMEIVRKIAVFISNPTNQQ